MTPLNQAIAIFWRHSRRQFVEVTAQDAAMRLKITPRQAGIELEMLAIADLACFDNHRLPDGSHIKIWRASKTCQIEARKQFTEDMI